MKELEFHPYANLFPLIEGKAFDDLVADIKANGIRESIVMHEGKILDGRNRYRAGVAAGVIGVDGKLLVLDGDAQPSRRWFQKVEGDPLAFVISANLHRRHLSETQRAMVASRLANGDHGGDRAPAEQAANLPDAPAKPATVTQAKAAELLNVSERSVRSAKAVVEHGAPELVAKADAGAIAVSVAAELAKLPVEEQREVLKKADPGALYRVIKDQRDALTAQKKTKRAEKVKALGVKQRALPAKKYGVIYADPEWEHLPWSEQGQNKAAANHYPVSSTAVIKARPVKDIAADDCVLFMWTTVPHLAVAFDVVSAWGFTYRSSAVWKKVYPGKQQGLGYWFRVNHEILLVATRGNVPAPAPGTQWGSVIEAPVGEHSEKPDAVYELIESYFGDLPKIELNARKARPGWDVWGLEAPEAEPRCTAAMVDGDGGKVTERELQNLVDVVNAGGAAFKPVVGGGADQACDIIRLSDGTFESPGRGTHYGSYQEGVARDGLGLHLCDGVVRVTSYWDGYVGYGGGCMAIGKVRAFLRALAKWQPPAPADADISDADIPAFLKRDPDTAEMFPETAP